LQSAGRLSSAAVPASFEDWINWSLEPLGYDFYMAIKIIKAFLRDESGATAIEYGLIAAGISIAIIVTVNGIGTKLNTKFASVSSQLK
jgi:pilus assembly protein Flp/PilA